VINYARAKLAAKGCDLVIANDVSAPDAGFAVDTNRVIVVDREATIEVPLADKATVAHRILDAIAPRLSSRAAT
jgi:phosphopantothenoylcysteine decarboxylase/phosphopantothenate--cysteine ligase